MYPPGTTMDNRTASRSGRGAPEIRPPSPSHPPRAGGMPVLRNRIYSCDALVQVAVVELAYLQFYHGCVRGPRHIRLPQVEAHGSPTRHRPCGSQRPRYGPCEAPPLVRAGGSGILYGPGQPRR